MLIYYLIIACLTYLCIFKNFSTRQLSNHLHSIFPLLLLFPLIALRSDTVGTDLVAYVKEFEYARYSFENNLRGWERGYELLLYFVHSLNLSFQFILVIIAFITLHSLHLLFKRYSSDIPLSYVIFFCFGSFAFSLSGLRQALAISFAIYAVLLFLDKRFLMFILFTLIGSLFHLSAIILFIVPILSVFNFSRFGASFLFALTCVFYFFPVDSIVEALLDVEFAYIQAYAGFDDSVNPLVILLNAMFPLFALIMSDKSFYTNRANRLFYIFSLANLAIILVSIQLPMLSRLALYFSIFMTVLVPNVIVSLRPIYFRSFASLFFVLLGILNFAISVPDNSIGIDQYSFMRMK